MLSYGISSGSFYFILSSSTSVFGAVFEPYKDKKVDLLGPKLVFIAINMGAMALGIWKVIDLSL